ncbi:hypothetical protein KDK95_19265 [Actinospica sp. MGRD01-02]|uniref:Aromatic ring-opening dioxygenase LigA n=1 Tax=Actinospica acidithermotolerans TaxID=2828514 RepID=A0A941EG32_9ACTN|nr:hypothetical protein [Actinospica acidithermotolerans]MBR7828459.1 hypothetical protein [Actinospica acidithermotolerans]
MLHAARSLVRWLAALTGAALLVAGPIMIGVGISGQHQVTDQLTAQQITFPARGSASLPAAEAGYAGQLVTTGPQAKAFSDMIETHIKEATGGKTYSQVSGAYMAAAADKSTPAATLATLANQRQTAFMGESLRGSLLSAYQAWEVTYLVIGLGIAFTGIGAVTLFGAAVALATARRSRKITVPDTAAALTEPGLNV